jgi:hypothetical protein
MRSGPANMDCSEPLLENPDDLARLEYGRMLWRNPRNQKALLAHWLDPRHPYRERFCERRPLIERVLAADPAADDALESELRQCGHSLRTLMREIPPVFGQFFPGFAAPPSAPESAAT